MKARWTMLVAAAALATLFSLAGCDGDDGQDGQDGQDGAAGPPGTACWDLNANGVGDVDEDVNGDGVVDALDCQASTVEQIVALQKPEGCATCHGGVGVEHQDAYDAYVDQSDIKMTFDSVSSVQELDLSYTVTLDFTILDGNGNPLVLTASEFTSLPQKTFYAVRYDSATRTFLDSKSFSTSGVVSNGDGTYSLTQTGFTYAPEASNAIVTGYIARNEIVAATGGRVRLYDEMDNAGLVFGDAATYVSTANVEGCIKCHGEPYGKHGYRQAAEVDTDVPDFTACKTCHYDDRDGGHEDWQWMVDDPVAWADWFFAGGDIPAEVLADYAYKASIMNDVHMSHAMEFPYPMSMANCATCHAGKLGQVLTDANFKATTCKSCHPVQDSGEYAQASRAPALEKLWADAGVTILHSEDANCGTCHNSAVDAPGSTFAEYHSGYDARIYDETGTKHASANTLSIDSVTVDGDLVTVEFSATNTAIVPELGVGFYGWDSKHFLVAQHTRDGNVEACPTRGCRMEYVPESSGGDPNPLFTEEEGSVPGAWIVTLDTAAYQATVTDPIPQLIADGKVKLGEVVVLGELEVDGVPVGLDAATYTFDVADGTEVADYFQAGGAVADAAKCNNCHDQLAVTFHGNGAGGNVTACRACHVTTSGGSHLEMQSRGIDSYVHAIHAFQAFDPGDIDFADNVEAARYELHIEHTFPLFTLDACEGCHVDGTVTYNVPDQSQSMPGLLSASDSWNVDRNIGTVPEYVTGPASRACGGCHRAHYINEDMAGELTAFNAHVQMGGYLVENDEEDSILYGIINKIMGLFE